MSKKYRIKEAIGPYWNKRWEVQEQYTYYENGELITAWHDIFHSSDRKMCEDVMERRISEPPKPIRKTCSADYYDLPFMA